MAPTSGPAVDGNRAVNVGEAARKYGNLRNYIAVMQVVGVLGSLVVGGIGIVILINVISDGSADQTGYRASLGGFCILAGFLNHIAWMASAEFLQLAIDVEENTRQLVSDNRKHEAD